MTGKQVNTTHGSLTVGVTGKSLSFFFFFFFLRFSSIAKVDGQRALICMFLV